MSGTSAGFHAMIDILAGRGAVTRGGPAFVCQTEATAQRGWYSSPAASDVAPLCCIGGSPSSASRRL